MSKELLFLFMHTRVFIYLFVYEIVLWCDKIQHSSNSKLGRESLLSRLCIKYSEEKQFLIARQKVNYIQENVKKL